MAMYKITVRQVNELTDYVEADSKEMAEYIAKQRVGKGIYNLDSVDNTGEIVITAEESDNVPLSEMNVFNDSFDEIFTNGDDDDDDEEEEESRSIWDQDNISGSLSDLR